LTKTLFFAIVYLKLQKYKRTLKKRKTEMNPGQGTESNDFITKSGGEAQTQSVADAAFSRVAVGDHAAMIADAEYLEKKRREDETAKASRTGALVVSGQVEAPEQDGGDPHDESREEE
jgi:hypothetical protein